MTLAPLIDVQTLMALPARRYRYLDASILLPGQAGDPDAAFHELAFPKADRFRINEICEKADSLPHMVPGPAVFAAFMTDLGISRETGLIFYDQKGSVGACRAHWMASLFGHDSVHVLDGGLDAFIQAGRSLDEAPEPAARTQENYVTRARYTLLAGKGDVFAALNDPNVVILDARSRARFHAIVPEPRPNTRGGHMPGAVNLPYSELLDERGCFLQPEMLVARLRGCDIGNRRVITSCGSGLTAATLTMALRAAGFAPGQLYDGSWAEWGGDAAAPIESS